MNPLALRIVARYLRAGPVLEFKPKPKHHVPIIHIGGKSYFLSSEGGSLGEEMSPPDGSGAKLIEVAEPSTPWRFLWVYDTERQHLSMWHIDGREKVDGPARSEMHRIVRLEKRGELNRVTTNEYHTIQREMAKREDAQLASLKQQVEEMKTDFDKVVGSLAQEFFAKFVQQKVEKAIADVKAGSTPIGFKAHSPENKVRQMAIYVIGVIFGRDMTLDKVSAFVKSKGYDPETDPQAIDWAIKDVLEVVYDTYPPPREGF